MNPEREEALLLAYQSAAPRLDGMTFNAFAAATQSFEVHPVHVGKRPCGAVLVRGTEMHACVQDWARGRWFGRREAALLDRVIEQHGEATTSATTEAGRLFVERLGFINDSGIYRRSKKWASNR